MDAIAYCRQQHEELADLFDDFELDDSPEEKRVVANEVGDMLLSHMAAEEMVFFPAVGITELESSLQEATETHLVAKRLVSELKVLDPNDVRFEAKFRLLRRLFEQHVAHEEVRVLRVVGAHFTHDSLRAIGVSMEHLYEELQHGPRVLGLPSAVPTYALTAR